MAGKQNGEKKSKGIYNLVQKDVFAQGYSTIRQFFRYTCLSGCCAADDYEKWCGVGYKNANKLKKVYRALANELELTERRSNKKSVTAIHGYFADAGQVLANSYRMCSLSSNKLLFDLAILGVLQAETSGEALPRSDIKKRAMIGAGSAFLNESNYVKAFKELEQYGAICCQADKKYYLASDVLHVQEMLNDGWENLYDEITHWLKSADFAVPGYFLLERINRERRIAGKAQLESMFFYRGDHYYAMAEEDLVLALTRWIAEGEVLEITYAKGQRYAKQTAMDESYQKWYERALKEPTKTLIVPLKISKKDFYGREYLLAYDLKQRKFMPSLRIDRIQSLKAKGLQKKITIPSSAREEYKLSFSLVEQNMAEEQVVKLLRRDFGRYLAGDIVQKEGLYHFTVQIEDFTKLFPVIYRYGHQLQFVPKQIDGDKEEKFLSSIAARIKETVGVYSGTIPVRQTNETGAADNGQEKKRKSNDEEIQQLLERLLAAKGNKTSKKTKPTLLPSKLFCHQNNELYACVEEILRRKDDWGIELDIVVNSHKGQPFTLDTEDVQASYDKFKDYWAEWKKEALDVKEKDILKNSVNKIRDELVKKENKLITNDLWANAEEMLYILAACADERFRYMPISLLERQFLYDMLQHKTQLLFLDEAQQKALMEVLEKPEVTAGCAAWQEAIEPPRQQTAYSKSEQQSLQMIRRAIRQDSWLQKSETEWIYPVKISYDVEVQEHILLGWQYQAGKHEVAAYAEPLNEMAELQIVPDEVAGYSGVIPKQEILYQQLQAEETVLLKVQHHRPDILERGFALFNQYEKEGYIEQEDVHQLQIRYFRFEKDKLVKDILSMGSGVEVLAPQNLREYIKQEWEQTQQQYDILIEKSV